ncbi:hypothetical protein ES703_70891 [subsurface metagenome]
MSAGDIVKIFLSLIFFSFVAGVIETWWQDRKWRKQRHE